LIIQVPIIKQIFELCKAVNVKKVKLRQTIQSIIIIHSGYRVKNIVFLKLPLTSDVTTKYYFKPFNTHLGGIHFFFNLNHRHFDNYHKKYISVNFVDFKLPYVLPQIGIKMFKVCN